MRFLIKIEPTASAKFVTLAGGSIAFESPGDGTFTVFEVTSQDLDLPVSERPAFRYSIFLGGKGGLTLHRERGGS